MAIHEEPNGGEGGRTVADRVPISSLFGAEAISSVGNNNITTLAVLGGPLVDRLAGPGRAAAGSAPRLPRLELLKGRP